MISPPALLECVIIDTAQSAEIQILILFGITQGRSMRLLGSMHGLFLNKVYIKAMSSDQRHEGLSL